MNKKVIYYHTNWSTYGRNYQIADLPNEVQDISYAFFNLDANGNVFSGDSYADFEKRFTTGKFIQPVDTWNDPPNITYWGNFGQIRKLQALRPLNVTLSIGGWTWSTHFSTAMSSEQSRQNMINQIINIFKKYPIFSGVSIDWEYLTNNGINYGNSGNSVSVNDSKNFIIFLKNLRSAFNQNNMSNFSIAMCATGDPNKCKFEVEEVHPLINELHVMTYDFHDGAWGETVSAFHTNPRKSKFGTFSCEEAADYYLSRGVPSTKIYIGAAFYSRGFSNTDGPGKSASGGSSDMSWEKGMVDYKVLPLPGATEYNDPESKAAYSYDPVKRILNTYDNKISIIEKCKIIKEKNLGGIIIWESSGDKPINDPNSLIKTLYNELLSNQPQPTPQPIPQPTPQPTPQPIPQPIPQPTPQPIPPKPVPQPPQQDVKIWKAGVKYELNDKIVHNNVVYVCNTKHISSNLCKPGLVIWKEI